MTTFEEGGFIILLKYYNNYKLGLEKPDRYRSGFKKIRSCFAGYKYQISNCRVGKGNFTPSLSQNRT